MTTHDARRPESARPPQERTPTIPPPAENQRASVPRRTRPSVESTTGSQPSAPRRPMLPSLSEMPAPTPDSPRAQLELESNDESPQPTALAVPRGFSPEDALDGQIRDLEAWAASIQRRTSRRAARFWVSRGFALLTAAGAMVAGLVGEERLLTALAAASALCIAVIAALHSEGGQSRQRRAVRDLRELQSAAKLRWDKVRLALPDPQSRKRVAHALALLEVIQSKREEIGRYLGSAEPNPGLRRGPIQR